MKHHYLKALAVSVVAVLSSCGVSREQSGAVVGAQGGTITLSSGLEMEIPPGALSDDTTLSVTEVRGATGEREIELEPHGRDLAVPARLSVPDDTGRSAEAEFEGGARVAAHRNGRGRLEIEVHRLERIRVAHREDGDGGEIETNRHDGGVDDHGGGGHGADDLDGGAATGGTGAACVDDDTCACGSECVTGQCTAVVTCASDANCTGGATCREGRRSGVACGVFACHL